MHIEIDHLIGKVLLSVRESGSYDALLTFTVSDTEAYELYHSQSCCESVCLVDTIGDLDDLTGTPILHAVEISSEPPARSADEYEPESETWTFYRISTIKGTVVLRFQGTSNGCYSESVDFRKVGDSGY